MSYNFKVCGLFGCLIQSVAVHIWILLVFVPGKHFADLYVGLQLYFTIFNTSTISNLAISTTTGHFHLLFMCIFDVCYTLVCILLQAAEQALFRDTEAD